MSGARIPGFCPMGCGQTLFAASGGYITCSWHDCPRPDAASDILLDRETEHIVTLTDDDFTIRHPLRERLDEQLEACALHAELNSHSGPPMRPGRYRVLVGSDGRAIDWEAVR